MSLAPSRLLHLRSRLFKSMQARSRCLPNLWMENRLLQARSDCRSRSAQKSLTGLDASMVSSVVFSGTQVAHTSSSRRTLRRASSAVGRSGSSWMNHSQWLTVMLTVSSQVLLLLFACVSTFSLFTRATYFNKKEFGLWFMMEACLTR